MPIPGGIISTSEGPVDPNESVVEEVLDAELAEANAEEAVEEYQPNEN